MLKYTANLIFSFLLVFSLNCFAKATGDKSALIIIDMQPIFVTRGGNHNEAENQKKVKEILKTQIEAINFAKKSKIPIIFIEYEGMGETNAELKKAAAGYAEVKTFLKNTDGMFSPYNKHRSKLVEYLESKEIGNLIITGANGGACVLQSIEGSLADNYNVLAFNTAIADFNYKEFIYPYNKQYSFNPRCENCKFNDVDDINVVALNLSTKRFKKTTDVNDSKRTRKEISIDSGSNDGTVNNSGLPK